MSVSSKMNENDVACLIHNSDNDKLAQNIELRTGMKMKPNKE